MLNCSLKGSSFKLYKETEKLIQKTVWADGRITVDLDSSKSNQKSNSKRDTSAWTVLTIPSSTLLAAMFVGLK